MLKNNPQVSFFKVKKIYIDFHNTIFIHFNYLYACYGNKRELNNEFPFVIYYSNSIVLTSGTSGIKACLIFI